MAEVLTKITGMTPGQAERRAEIVEEINNELTMDEMEKLLKIAQSEKAKSYLSSDLKWMTLKSLLKL